MSNYDDLLARLRNAYKCCSSSWMFCGPLAADHPYATTGATLARLGLTPHPEA